MISLELTDVEANALKELLRLGGNAAKEKNDYYLLHYAKFFATRLRRKKERVTIIRERNGKWM